MNLERTKERRVRTLRGPSFVLAVMKRIVGAIVGIALAGLAATVALLAPNAFGVSPLDRTDTSIVFVCRNGVAMSVWSALRFNELAEERGLLARASARAAARTFTTVPIGMKFALAYDRYAIGGYLPKVVSTDDLRRADHLVLIDTELPPSVSVDGTEIEHWGGFPPMRERYVASRAELRKRVDELVARVASEQETPAISRAARGGPMNLSSAFQPTISGLLIIIAAMVAVALIELLVPLHARGHWNRVHLKPNLALTLLTFATNIFLNAGLLMLVMWLESKNFGLMHWLSLSSFVAGICVVLALDFSFYAAHVSWHKVPWLWRFHAVHHSDPALDVTSTIRQHPVEGLLRYAVMGVMVIVLGPSVAAFTVYRVASALNALLEHANIRAPRWLDAALSLVTSWPHMHKVHHSRIVVQTDSNYGNLFSFWDRLFGTFTPTQQGTTISYGLEGTDDPASQTTRGLLAAPFHDIALARAALPVLRPEQAEGHSS